MSGQELVIMKEVRIDKIDELIQKLHNWCSWFFEPLQGEVYTISEMGNGHEKNQDSAMDVRNPKRIMVADGISAGFCSEIAAHLVTILCSISRKTHTGRQLIKKALWTHEDVQQYYAALGAGAKQGGTTLTMAEIRRDCVASILHIGDSRGYLLTANLLGGYHCRQVTVDQTWGELKKRNDWPELKERLIREWGFHDPDSLPDNTMYHAIGYNDLWEDEIAVTTLKLPPGGILLLATDGAFKSMGDNAEAEFASLAASCGSLEELGQAIVRQAQERGERDDISVSMYRPAYFLHARWWFWMGFFIASAMCLKIL